MALHRGRSLLVEEAGEALNLGEPVSRGSGYLEEVCLSHSPADVVIARSIHVGYNRQCYQKQSGCFFVQGTGLQFMELVKTPGATIQTIAVLEEDSLVASPQTWFTTLSFHAAWDISTEGVSCGT
jgi:hypothetical protein